MEEADTIASKIKRGVLAFTITLVVIFTLVVLAIAYSVSSNNVTSFMESTSRSVSSALFEPFLARNFSTLNTAADQLVNNRDELGIQYMAIFDDRGRYTTSTVHSNINQDNLAYLEDERFQDDETYYLYELNHFETDTGLSIAEVNVPVSADDSNYGSIKLGFNRDFITRGWPQLRNQILATGAVLGLFAVLIVLFLSGRWESRIETRVSSLRNNLENKYESKLEKLEEEATSGPLDSDEFFELIDFAKEVNRSLDPAEVLKYVVNSVASILTVRQVVIFLISPEDPETLIGQMGMKDGEWMDRNRLQNIEIEIGSGEIGTVAELGQTNIVDRPRPGASVASAIEGEGSVVGVVRATNKKTGVKMSQKDKLKVRLIAEMAGDAIYNAFQVDQRNNNVTE